MIQNLGEALSILNRANAVEQSYDIDLRAFHAPSECYEVVHRGEAQRLRQARRHAEAIAARPYRVIMREARKRGYKPRHAYRIQYNILNRWWGGSNA